jgi:integrase
MRNELDKIVFEILGKKVIKEEVANNQDPNVFTYFQKFIDDTESGLRLHNGIRMGQSTFKTYKTFQNHLEVIDKKYRITFESLLSDKFLPALQSYCVKNNHSDYYCKMLLKICKTFLIWCEHKKYIEKVDTHLLRMHVRTNDQDKIALTETQLAMIENADLDIVFPDKKKAEITKEVQSYRANLKRTRDLFLLQCYTGLRFSDACRIKAGNIYLNNPIPIIKIQTQKTGQELIIPIGKKLLEILKRHEKPEEFCNRSGQKYNEALHELARVCELTEQIEVVSFVGGKEQRSQKSLDKLISSHTGRRTFITIALMRGKSPSVIMQFSGHKTLSSFQKYIRIAEQQALQEMSDIF